MAFQGSWEEHSPPQFAWVGRSTRQLRLVSPLIELSHPVTWTTADRSGLWVSTLFCGEEGALVVAVNEDVISAAAGFRAQLQGRVCFAFPALPWLTPKAVLRVTDGALVPLAATREYDCLSWIEPEVADAALYLLPGRRGLTRELEERVRTELPVATAAGKALEPEAYLTGRRSRWTP